MTAWTSEQLSAVLNKGHVSIAGARIVRGRHTKDEERGPKPKKEKAKRVIVPKRRVKYEYEKQLALQLATLGFREFEVDARYLPDRLHRADVLFRREMLVVEIQGHAHRIRDKWVRDIEKAQLTLMAGYRLLPVSTKQVKTGVAADIVRKAIDLHNIPFKPE